MKVAVASSDGASISQHFGRSAAWLVFEIQDKRIIGKEVRPNRHTHHAATGCGGDSHGDGPHSHQGLISALTDCEAILCGGMGWRAAEDLRRNGIEPYVVGRMKTPEEAIEMFTSGQLAGLQHSFCRGRHAEGG